LLGRSVLCLACASHGQFGDVCEAILFTAGLP